MSLFPLFTLLFAMTWWDWMPLSLFSECWVLSQFFLLSSFTLIQRLFSFSSLSAIRVELFAYLRLLIFLSAILIPAFEASSLAFCMMYSACKLNKQGDDVQPWYTPFSILNCSIVPSRVLTIASCLEYRFLKRQVRWSGILISKNFPQFVVIHTVKDFSIVNETEVDAFLKFPCFFYDSVDVGNFDLCFLCLF